MIQSNFVFIIWSKNQMDHVVLDRKTRDFKIQIISPFEQLGSGL